MGSPSAASVILCVLAAANLVVNIYFWRKLMAEAGNAKERIQTFQNKTLEALADLENEVTEVRGQIDSAITFIEGIKKQLDEAVNSGNITERILALRGALDEKQEALAQAIDANPAEPTDSDYVEEGEEPPLDHPEDPVVEGQRQNQDPNRPL